MTDSFILFFAGIPDFLGELLSVTETEREESVYLQQAPVNGGILIQIYVKCTLLIGFHYFLEKFPKR